MSVAHSTIARTDRREQPRKGTLWHGTLRTLEGLVACRVLNLSALGAKLEVDADLAPRQPVTLIMEPLGEFSGVVTWQRNGQTGIRINEHRTTRTKIVLPRSFASGTILGD